VPHGSPTLKGLKTPHDQNEKVKQRLARQFVLMPANLTRNKNETQTAAIPEGPAFARERVFYLPRGAVSR
jgi:hypothetical protein